MNVVRVLKAGLSSTIQDLGRPGFRHFGVAVCGAMDRLSHELANRLVGNSPTLATIEMTLLGDELEWSRDSVVSITGADMSPVMMLLGSNCELPVPCQTAIVIAAGTRLRFHNARRGCRTYVAVAGGFDVPVVMNSRATYLKAAIGGFHGRTLKAGDELPVAFPTSQCSDDYSECFGERQKMDRRPIVEQTSQRLMDDWNNRFTMVKPLVRLVLNRTSEFPSWFVRPVELPNSQIATLRVVRGSHFDCLTHDSQHDFITNAFQVSPQSDRMGYRLSGPSLDLAQPLDLLSAGTALGTIQLPPDGNPILLMADSAPTGGYPRIAHVISADLPNASQLRPGQEVRFEEVSIEHAQLLYRRQRNDLQKAIVMNNLLRVQHNPTWANRSVPHENEQRTDSNDATS